MKATRDIKEGEIILTDKPLVCGPKVASVPLCLGCNKQLQLKPNEKNFYKCRKCTWPLCSESCEENKNHKLECALMGSKKFVCKIDANKNDESKKESAYCVILPLRCLLLREKNPDGFKKLLELEDHLEERIETPLYHVLKANLLTFVKTILGFSDLEETDVLKIAAILDTNSFEIRQNNIKIRALFPQASMFSHDCTSNARHYFDDDMNITFIAKTKIFKGEVISISYNQPLKSTIMRREHLKQAKCFECSCKRCKDPKEFDTYIGSPICIKCKVGKIVSSNPMDNSAPWICNNCGHSITAKLINYGNRSIQEEIENLNKFSPKVLEEFIIKFENMLHPTNTHILEVKYALTQLYGNIEGFFNNELNNAAVQRKYDLCNELLEIANKFDPGLSLFRGNLLIELQEIMVLKAKRDFEAGLDTKENTKVSIFPYFLFKFSINTILFQEKLDQAMEVLKEAMKILILEPEMKPILEQKTRLLTEEIL